MRLATVIVDRANYGRLKPLTEQLELHVDQIVLCGGTTVLDRFRRPVDEIARFHRVEEIHSELEGDRPLKMARGAGLSCMEYAAAYERHQVDAVLVIGDRYEALGAAVAAAMMGLCLIHIQGGEVSGTLDELSRHAITKLAQYHVPATPRAAEYLVRMGEHPERILAVGCPSADIAAMTRPLDRYEVLVSYHPDTAQPDKSIDEIRAILATVENLARRTLILWPNIDAGSDVVAKQIRCWRDLQSRGWCDLRTNLEPDQYAAVLAGVGLCLGNSSSFVRDAGFYGTPVVLVGDRQSRRECGSNVLRATQWEQIQGMASRQLNADREPSWLYGRPGISVEIANKIAGVNTDVKKQLAYEDAGHHPGSRRQQGDRAEEYAASQRPHVARTHI